MLEAAFVFGWSSATLFQQRPQVASSSPEEWVIHSLSPHSGPLTEPNSHSSPMLAINQVGVYDLWTLISCGNNL